MSHRAEWWTLAFWTENQLDWTNCNLYSLYYWKYVSLIGVPLLACSFCNLYSLCNWKYVLLLRGAQFWPVVNVPYTNWPCILSKMKEIYFFFSWPELVPYIGYAQKCYQKFAHEAFFFFCHDHVFVCIILLAVSLFIFRYMKCCEAITSHCTQY